MKNEQKAKDELRRFSHDVKTPVAVIKVGADGLKDVLPRLIAAYELCEAKGLLEGDKAISSQQLRLLAPALDSIQNAAVTITDRLSSFRCLFEEEVFEDGGK